MTDNENDESKKLTIAQEDRLSLQLVPEQSLASALQELLPEDFDCIAIPPEFAHLTDIPRDRQEEIISAQVTPELLSQMTPDGRRALDQLLEDVKRAGSPAEALGSNLIAGRAAKLIIAGAPYSLVLTKLAKAAKQDGSESLAVMYDYACCGLAEFQDSLRSPPVRPAFDHDEFVLMAEYVHNGMPMVTAAGPREFYDGDRAVPPHLVDVFIHRELEKADIWDPQRRVLVTVSNRLVAEVRGALARKYPRLPTVGGDPMAPIGNVIVAPLSRPSVSAFAHEELLLTPRAWTASEAIWSAWVAWCKSARHADWGSRAIF